ncbi:MAG: NAD(P)H-quinone oxidoreductase [Myxococcales bacterium]|nr:NAD(P)H-quinone oxidoreductase [Myxococcales bacterium]MCB9530837.1 NAD(P)H-quinone oxidoreductase [Myxococcales bacterium]
MRATTIDQDDARTLRWSEAETPTPGPGQVLLRVAATAINRADLLQRRGLYPVPPGASEILGLEVAGTVVACGDDVTGWRVGDLACALLEGGGYAEYVAIDASMLLPIPEGLGLVEAAALPEVVYTAYLNIVVEPALRPGETVLVHAAASGVGTCAVQLCCALGHRCIATASADKLDAVRALGADVALDRRDEGLLAAIVGATDGHGVDVILDPVGASLLETNLRALAVGGRLINIGLLGGAAAPIPLGLVLTRRLRIIGSVLRSRSRADKVALTGAILREVWPLISSGAVRPVIDSVVSIEDANAAHARLATNATVGKVVLTIPG